jgi:hypothetical protein
MKQEKVIRTNRRSGGLRGFNNATHKVNASVDKPISKIIHIICYSLVKNGAGTVLAGGYPLVGAWISKFEPGAGQKITE